MSLQIMYNTFEPYNSVETAWMSSAVEEIRNNRNQDNILTYAGLASTFVLAAGVLIVLEPVIILAKVLYNVVRCDLSEAVNAFYQGCKNEVAFFLVFSVLSLIFMYGLCAKEGVVETLRLTPAQASGHSSQSQSTASTTTPTQSAPTQSAPTTQTTATVSSATTASTQASTSSATWSGMQRFTSIAQSANELSPEVRRYLLNNQMSRASASRSVTTAAAPTQPSAPTTAATQQNPHQQGITDMWNGFSQTLRAHILGRLNPQQTTSVPTLPQTTQPGQQTQPRQQTRPSQPSRTQPSQPPRTQPAPSRPPAQQNSNLIQQIMQQSGMTQAELAQRFNAMAQARGMAPMALVQQFMAMTADQQQAALQTFLGQPPGGRTARPGNDRAPTAPPMVPRGAVAGPPGGAAVNDPELEAAIQASLAQVEDESELEVARLMSLQAQEITESEEAERAADRQQAAANASEREGRAALRAEQDRAYEEAAAEDARRAAAAQQQSQPTPPPASTQPAPVTSASTAASTQPVAPPAQSHAQEDIRQRRLAALEQRNRRQPAATTQAASQPAATQQTQQS